MKPPAGFEGQSQTLPAANRSKATGLLVDESFDLGPYRVTDIKGKSGSSSSGFQIGGLKVEKTTTAFTYRMVGGADGRTEVKGACASKYNETSLPLMSAVTLQRQRSTFSCDCSTQDQRHATLRIKGDSGWQGAPGFDPVTITVTLDGVEHTVDPYGANGQKVPKNEPFYGYRVEGASGAVAALGLSFPGTVWLHERLPKNQHEAMSCALAGLMLHRGP